MLGLFRKVALLEGISFLLLLFVAMPLKYVYGMPEAVKAAGWIHGVLFIAFVGLLWKVSSEEKWSDGFFAMVLMSGLVPFATFFMDRKLKALA
jgi:integral membrane protein